MEDVKGDPVQQSSPCWLRPVLVRVSEFGDAEVTLSTSRLREALELLELEQASNAGDEEEDTEKEGRRGNDGCGDREDGFSPAVEVAPSLGSPYHFDPAPATETPEKLLPRSSSSLVAAACGGFALPQWEGMSPPALCSSYYTEGGVESPVSSANKSPLSETPWDRRHRVDRRQKRDHLHHVRRNLQPFNNGESLSSYVNVGEVPNPQCLFPPRRSQSLRDETGWKSQKLGHPLSSSESQSLDRAPARRRNHIHHRPTPLERVWECGGGLLQCGTVPEEEESGRLGQGSMGAHVWRQRRRPTKQDRPSRAFRSAVAEEDDCYDSDPELLPSFETLRLKPWVASAADDSNHNKENIPPKQAASPAKAIAKLNAIPAPLPTACLEDLVVGLWNETFTWVLHGQQGSLPLAASGHASVTHHDRPLAVRVWLEHGQRLPAALIPPKLVWRPAAEQNRWTHHHLPHSRTPSSLSLLEIHRVVEADNFVPHPTLGGPPSSLAKRSRSFYVYVASPSGAGGCLLFETATDTQRHRVVHGLQLLVVRLAALWRAGDASRLWHEYFDVGFPPPCDGDSGDGQER